MKRVVNTLFVLALMLICSASASAVTITKTQGWFESGCVEWTWESGATYTVYYRPEGGTYIQLDKDLVRQYPTYGRADMVGLKAGKYQFKVVSSTSGEAESEVFTATAHDRSGFAHVGMTGGIGAYKNDGTLKDGANVLYVTANNAKTISTVVQTGSKTTATTTGTGLQDIIYLYQKGYDTTPLDIRIIGTITANDMDSFGSSAEGLQVKGKNGYSDMPITIEGIGDDATISGFGILVRNCHGTEFRNFAIMLCMDDCLSLDTQNSNIWIHNMDFFYGKTGGDSDQAKGDGTVDVKAQSKNCTIAYNHFYDSGKSSLGGMDSDEQACWHTYHHNWFDHSDSRHPRIRSQFFHVYNNYFDGNSKYGIGATTGGSAFVEANYFRNCKYPMLISKQGTDAEGDGTFSGEDGGVIKAYNNHIQGNKKTQYYTAGQTDGNWDAVLVTTRDEAVTATAYTGGTSYNSEADNAARTTYIENKMDDPEQIPTIVRGDLGAGRMNHGDFTWTFNNSVQDENYDVIADLKSALESYKSTLVGFADGTAIANGGATEAVNGGDGKGIEQAANDAYVPSYAGGGGTIVSDDKEAFIIGADNGFYLFNTDNDTQSKQYITNKVIVLDADSKYNATPDASDANKWGLNLKTSTGTCTFYNANGICSFSMKIYRTGSVKGDYYVSEDGATWTKQSSFSEKSKGSYTETLTLDKAYPYLKIANTSSGSMYIQGVQIFTKKSATTDISQMKNEESGTANAPCYNLAGQRVNGNAKGIVIKNGKKFMVK